MIELTQIKPSWPTFKLAQFSLCGSQCGYGYSQFGGGMFSWLRGMLVLGKGQLWPLLGVPTS